MNYFAVEPLLVQHLKEHVQNLHSVDTPFDIDDMLQNSQFAPSISVIYYGNRIGESSANGKVCSQYQQWLIVLKLNDPMAQSGHTNSLRAMANPFILQLLDCMQGFNPNLLQFREFKQVDSPVTVGSGSGFGYFPFMFEVQMFI